MRERRLIGTAVVVLLALAPTACGGSGGDIASRSPDVIVARATKAIDGVRSVRVTGSIPDGSSVHPIRLNLQLLNGKGATGSMSENGLSFRLITVGGNAYISGSQGFLRQFAGVTAAARLNGKWLRGSASSGRLASLNSLTDVRPLLSALLNGHGPLTKGATSTIAGQRVIALHDTSKHGTLYVATKGPPYPIRITNTGSDGGELSFGDFDAKVTLVAPPASIDIANVTH